MCVCGCRGRAVGQWLVQLPHSESNLVSHQAPGSWQVPLTLKSCSTSVCISKGSSRNKSKSIFIIFNSWVKCKDENLARSWTNICLLCVHVLLYFPDWKSPARPTSSNKAKTKRVRISMAVRMSASCRPLLSYTLTGRAGAKILWYNDGNALLCRESESKWDNCEVHVCNKGFLHFFFPHKSVCVCLCVRAHRDDWLLCFVLQDSAEVEDCMTPSEVRATSIQQVQLDKVFHSAVIGPSSFFAAGSRMGGAAAWWAGGL